jgi:hypothetical protein
MFQMQIINISESMFQNQQLFLFTIQCFRIKNINVFHTHLFCLHVVFDICFSTFFFCSHRHDCGLYTTLYIESWNGKNMETILQLVIAATY